MKYLVIATFSILALMSMISCKPVKPEGEGITGKVTWLEGNQMPSPTEEKSKEVNPKGVPAERLLLIYPLTNVADTQLGSNGLFSSVSGEALETVKTDENGRYQVRLSPGRYSIFTQEEEGLFANIFDGEGNIQPVTVTENEWTLLDIIINYKAVF